jgi:hypothetical protein
MSALSQPGAAMPVLALTSHGHALTAASAATPGLSSAGASAGPSVLLAAVLSGAVLAALITATINIWLARAKSREEERSRLRANFADAFAAYAAYKEFPYAIRRRRSDAPSEERIRLSEALREIQARLAYHTVWTKAESKSVGSVYAEMVHQARQIAGAAMRAAWSAPPMTSDEAMNIPPATIDLSPLALYEERYIAAVQAHLQAVTRWGRVISHIRSGRQRPLQHAQRASQPDLVQRNAHPEE